MKIDERALTMLAQQPSRKEGSLRKRGERSVEGGATLTLLLDGTNAGFQLRWFALQGNVLFYSKSKQSVGYIHAGQF